MKRKGSGRRSIGPLACGNARADTLCRLFSCSTAKGYLSSCLFARTLYNPPQRWGLPIARRGLDKQLQMSQYCSKKTKEEKKKEKKEKMSIKDRQRAPVAQPQQEIVPLPPSSSSAISSASLPYLSDEGKLLWDIKCRLQQRTLKAEDVLTPANDRSTYLSLLPADLIRVRSFAFVIHLVLLLNYENFFAPPTPSLFVYTVNYW